MQGVGARIRSRFRVSRPFGLRLPHLRRKGRIAVAYGLDNEEIEIEFPDLIKERISAAINDPDERFFKSVSRARERLYFIETKPT